MQNALELRHDNKSEHAFRTISEVSEELDVPQHVLRFWESRFSQIKPLKRKGGRRYYRPEDIAIIRRIKTLLYSQGYTIKGAQKAFSEGLLPDAMDYDASIPVSQEPELMLARVSEKLITKLESASYSSRKKHQDELREVLKDLYKMREMLKTMVA
jgi:DNA-binding transcriptional MerR regulator